MFAAGVSAEFGAGVVDGDDDCEPPGWPGLLFARFPAFSHRLRNISASSERDVAGWRFALAGFSADERLARSPDLPCAVASVTDVALPEEDRE